MKHNVYEITCADIAYSPLSEVEEYIKMLSSAML